MIRHKKSTTLEITAKIPKMRWFILFLILAGGSVSCFNSNSNTFLNVDAMLCEQKPKPPISNSADAICSALYVDGVADSLRIAQQRSKYEGWTVNVLQGSDFIGWDIRIRSYGKILPTYECSLLLNENGSLRNKELLCRYKK